MADRIKEMQRSDPIAKDQWYAYCEAYGDNIRDPSKHDARFINAFISQYNSGARLEFKEGATLCQFIKMGQKKSQAWKTVWESYCDTKPIDGRPKHDPAKHDSGFIEGFFDYIGRQALSGQQMGGRSGGIMPMMHMSPYMSEPPAKRMRGPVGAPVPANNSSSRGRSAPPTSRGGENDNELVQVVKAYQRQGEGQKNTWHEYCDTNLDGVRDPSRHDAATLQAFISMHDFGTNNSSRGRSAPPTSRGGNDNELVQVVKAYQKQGEGQKNTWHQHCDTNLDGVRDPARHDAATLQAFISMHDL